MVGCWFSLLVYLIMTPFTRGLQINSIWPRVGSLAGGTKVTVWGSGFSTDAYNSVNLVFMGSIPCRVISYTATAYKLECVTEPYPGGVEGRSYPSLQSAVISEGQYHLTTGGNDAFRYHWSYTPQIRDIDPSAGPVGTLVEVGGYRFTWNYNAYSQFYLGGEVCELRDPDTNTRYGIRAKWPLLGVKCLTTEVRAGGWNASTMITGTNGRTWNHSQALYPMHDWSLAMYELYPDIHSMEPSIGSTTGGTMVTIKGSGFAGIKDDIEVDIDGIPCEVVSHTSTLIKCWSGAPPSNSPAVADSNMEYPSTNNGLRFKGGRGVRVHQYRSIGGSSLSSLHSSSKYPDNPDYIYSLPSFSTGSNTHRHNSYGERLMAFFSPHSSGRHSLFLSNDDGAEVWLGEGPNITTAYQNSILESPYATGFENYERHAYQRSEVTTMTEGQDYMIIGEFKEGGGGEYLTIGALLHDDITYSYSETQQAVREEQRVTLTSAGLYDIQTLSVAVNRSGVDSEDPPHLVMEWGGRETDPIPVLELEENSELIGEALLNLFSGLCEFDRTFGINQYPGPESSGFEGGVRSQEVWSSWNGSPPEITEEEALCGRHSLYVQDSRALAFNLENDNGLKTSDYPFLCLGYKLPPGHSMALAVNVKDYGWYSIPLSGPDTGPFPFTVLSSFFDEEYVAYPSDTLMNDDRWHYSCTDIQFMLIENLQLEEDEDPARFHYILGVGLYTNPDPERRGFYVDEVSLASERRALLLDSYVAPARPNGRSLSQVVTTASNHGNNDILNLIISMELVPSSCVNDLPLINLLPTQGTGVLSASLVRTQSASTPLGGNYTLTFDGQTTVPLQHDATEEQIKTALESLNGVGVVTVTYDSTPLSHDLLGEYCPGRSYSVVFETTTGDLPIITIDQESLIGDDVISSVEEVKTGGLFLRPIPGHMLQTVETIPQVHVRVRGQLAACSGGHKVYEEVLTEDHSDFCGFIYAPSVVPTVSMVTPSSTREGSVITISGTGFSETPEENFVSFGITQCDMIASTSTQISCTLGRGFGGYMELYIHVTSVGVANTGGLGISYEVSVYSVDVSVGSQAGGTAIVISGSGFYSTDFETGSGSLLHSYAQWFFDSVCQNGWENFVTIGDNPCDITDSTASTISCLTPEETGGVGVYDITVSVGCRDEPSGHESGTLSSGFSYDTALTPSVSGLSPSQGGVYGGESVTISGSGFGTDSTLVIVKIGREECVVTTVTDTSVTCLTPAHTLGVWGVEVVVTGRGRAIGTITFTYSVNITAVSHCSGSLLGGQVLSIQGSGFGTDLDLVAVSLGDRLCDVTSLNDDEILCVTSPTTQTHRINNNAEHPEYGLGYQWSPSTLTIHAGDTVHWSWTGSSFTARRGVAQVTLPGDTEYNGEGFRSGRSVTGSFSHTFTKPGVYYYIAEGYGHIGFNGTVIVSDLEDITTPLSLTINSVPIHLLSLFPVCQQTTLPFTDYTYSVEHTPCIVSVSPRLATPGETVNFTLTGLSEQAIDNVLVFGGRSPISCATINPEVISTNLVTPETSLSVQGVYSRMPVAIQCSMPSEIRPGSYRTILHVAGQGWANGVVEDTTVEIAPRIDSSPQVDSISLRGGVPLTFSTTGLLSASIADTRVLIGNTPCVVQSIAQDGMLTCLSQPALDDGYSSLIKQSKPVGYWSLQSDLANNEMDGIASFRNGGSAGSVADAMVVGSVELRQEGISGNSVTDQAAFFENSYIVVTPENSFYTPAGFSAEFWLKSGQNSDKYRILISSVSQQEVNGHEYLVVINPCNHIEFWVHVNSELKDQELGSAESQSSGHSGESSGDSLGHGVLGPIDTCDVISDVSMCASFCNGLLTVPETSTLPQGTWHVIRSVESDWSDWTHVYISWSVENDPITDEDCTSSNPCSGIQTLAINGESTTADTAFFSLPNIDFEIGGSSTLPIWTLGGDLTPFSGYIDEVAFYSRLLSVKEIEDHVHFGSTEDQPIWLTVEGVNGVGTGSVPNVEYPEWDVAFTDEVVLNWNNVSDESYVLGNSTALRFEWTGLQAVREVPRSVYESCDLEAPYIQQWTPPINGGQRSVWLESGRTHYFIDSVVGGCLDGRKLSAQVGDIQTIEWRVGTYSDITVTQGTGLLFQWDGSVMHDLVEMSAPIATAGDCVKVQSPTRDDIGLVAIKWLSEPTTTGEVFVTGLTPGQHHFICSVGNYCALGMRFTVTVLAEEEEQGESSEQTPQSHTIPWRIQYYDDFTMVEGETLTFSWYGFHSLHQVTEGVYESCDLSSPPLFEWGLPSVDNSVSIEGLTPGDYYFLCAVAGHCDAGMKIKVTVLPNDGLPVLDSGVIAVCREGVACSLAYSSESTPQLTSVEPAESPGGTSLTIRGSNLLPPGISPGTSLSDITVLIDKAPCINTIALTSDNASDHLISCSITDYESRYYHVDVFVSGRGQASVTPTQLTYGQVRDPTVLANFNSPYPKLFITAVASAIAPSSGSINGGTLVTVSGSGFSHIIKRNTVLLGEVPCRIVQSDSSSISCVTGPGTSTVGLTATVNGFPVSTSLMYEYSTDSTPEVTSITSSSGINSLSGYDDIEFSGVLIANSSLEVRVQIVPQNTEFVNFNTGDDCSIVSLTADPFDFVTVNCTAPNKPAGTYEVIIHVQGYGFASVSNDFVRYMLEVDSFSPMSGGYGGGLVLTVNGSGFPEWNEDTGMEQVTVTLCDGELENTSCQVVSSTLNQLTCILEPTSIESPFTTNSTCTLTVSFGGQTQSLSNSFKLLGSLTPRLNFLTPSIGGTGGGTTVTIEGEGLTSQTAEQPSVTIDGVECVINSASDTSITCLTGSHRTTLRADVSVFIPGKGNAVSPNGTVSYEYVDLWSSPFTWGGGPLPVDGDSVYIKAGQTVFLDVSTPVLNLILIEGSLIFQDEQDLHLQAHYIFINTGRLQVGTENSPFMHSATITLHGSVVDPEIPIYGAKVLGIRQGELDLHGRPRNVTWTRLSQSAFSNDTSLSLQQAVDWVPGDRIVIAPTGKDGNETEENEVLSVSGDGHMVTLATPLKFTHYGVTDYYEDGQFIDIRAEVGLLSHNVVVQGSRPLPSVDEDTIDPQYGSQIFVHRNGPHPTPIRIEHTEIRYGGQAFRLGRYAVHFHLSGTMAGSYVKNCAIHHSNNRAITAHGVHDLLIQGNVAYDIKGHTYFVEDGIETNNHYLGNLGVLTRGSSSLLNTDQIPATFWITNPQNTFIGNAAAASRAYGFWFDFDAFPSGASSTNRVCPNKEPFGVFHDNTAHTCNEFGLRIWEAYVPYADGCGATQPQEANLTDFTTYANGIHGVELSIVGHVRLIGFKVADNVQNGIEIIETLGFWGGPKVEDTLIISHTSVNNGPPQNGGLKTPNTPRLTVSNVTFVNFDLPSTTCLKACSHCKVRQGGFQVWFEELSFIGGSANHKTGFQWEFEVLYKDLDGSLTGLPDGGWVLPNSLLVPPQYCTPSVPEFSVNHTVINGTVCSSEINFLRMAWNNAEPLATLEGVRVLVSNEFGNTTIPWRHYRLTHLDGYMFTMPDGYEHRLVWDTSQEHRVDHTSYNAGVYGIRPGSRLSVTHEFIQTPDHVNVGGNHAPTSHGAPPIETDPNFSWHLENETDPNTVTYLISGHNLTDQKNNITFHYSYEPCPVEGCPLPSVDYGPYESFQRLWSDPESWPSGQVPQEGEDVTISSRWRMLLDVTPPTLGNVYILGELIFEDERDYNFTANLILIQGEMARVFIGSPESPFTHRVVITLNGRREDVPLPLSRRLTFGSKGIGVFGNLTIHGVPKETWTRLGVSALAGSTTLQLMGNDYPNWEIGDRIVIAPSGWEPAESEIRTVTDYQQRSGLVTLDQPLDYDHLVQPFLEQADIDTVDPPFVGGATPWWGDGGTLNPEVGLLSHNIIIQGGEDPAEPLEEHHYGCRVLVGEFFSGANVYNGRLKLDSVEVRHCGQGGYFSPRDPRYSIAFASGFETTAGSYIRRCSVHHGYNTAIGIHASYGIEVSQNVVWRTVDSGLKVGGTDNVVMDNLAMLTTTIQPNSPPDNHAVDFPATFDIDGDNVVRGNAAAGSTRIGFRYAGEPCLADNTSPTYDDAMFWDNTAHCGLMGLVVLGLPRDCTAIGGFTSTHQWNYGMFSSTASSLVTTHLKMGVGKVGLNLNVFGPNPVAHLLGNKFITISDSLIVGSLPGESCVTRPPSFLPPSVSFVPTDLQMGVMMSSFNQKRSKMDGTGQWHLMKGYPVIDGVVNMNSVSFARFFNSDCNYNSVAIANNPLSPDTVHPIHMSGTNKLSVDLNNLVFFYEPKLEWIVQEDCVDMDCDGPKHALIRDSDGRFTSTHPSLGSIIPFAELRFANYSHRLPVTWLGQGREGQALALPDEVLEHMGIARGETGNLDSAAGGCEWMGAWQGYRCKSLRHHMLVIESLDEDTETRRLSPLALNGGDTGVGHYTDLINGPMDHGWCVYYTCLKRLSTFFTVVAVGTDYCVWMTGSPPTQMRFHLLNAGSDDVISMCIFFKDTRRKDVYKNNIFIEPENVRYLEGGGIQQTDGSYRPNKERFGGANYFERQSQILYLIIRGSDPVEIRTPPVVQVSLSLAVSLDDFFNVGELIRNLAFVLKIDPNRIRVVEIVSENTAQRTRRSLLAVPDFNLTTLTIQIGPTPIPNITTTPPPTVEEEIMMAGETDDSVDVNDNTASETTLNITNPFNEDPPESVESFADGFNASVVEFLEGVEEYEEALAEVQEVNELGGQVVDLVLTGQIANLTNATVTGLSVVPATPPPSPPPPIIPPEYENVTTDEGDPVIIPIDEVVELPTVATPSGSNDTTGDSAVTIDFVIPSEMRVTMEPYSVTGHLVHVVVTVFDDSGRPVTNLGLVQPWLCQATLIHQLGSKDPLAPQLGGVTQVPFVRGVAEFTRLRVDKPGQDLILQFNTIPPRFQTTTSVSFQVMEPLQNTTRETIGFTLSGDTSSAPSDLTTAFMEALSQSLDVDISRIEGLVVKTISSGVTVVFDLLDRQPTDPPNVPGLQDTITELIRQLNSNSFKITVGGSTFTGVRGSFEYITPPPPTVTAQPVLEQYYALFIAVGSAVGFFLLLTVGVVCRLICVRRNKKGKEGKKMKEDKIPLHPIRKIQVTPLPPTDEQTNKTNKSGRREDHVTMFIRDGGSRTREGDSPSTHSEEEWSEGVTDDTSLGYGNEDAGRYRSAVDCWEVPSPGQTHPLIPSRFPPLPKRHNPISIARLAQNPSYINQHRQGSTPWAISSSENQRQSKRLPMSPGWDQ